MKESVKKALENLQSKVKKKKSSESGIFDFLNEFTKVKTPGGKELRIERMDAFGGRVLKLEARAPTTNEWGTRKWQLEPIWLPIFYMYKVAGQDNYAHGKFYDQSNNFAPWYVGMVPDLESAVDHVTAQIQAN